MSADLAIDLLVEALQLALLIASPMLGFGLVIGLAVSIFQSVTSIQEMTLTFIPKIVGVIVSLMIFAPWMLDKITTFTINLFNNLGVCRAMMGRFISLFITLLFAFSVYGENRAVDKSVNISALSKDSLFNVSLCTGNWCLRLQRRLA